MTPRSVLARAVELTSLAVVAITAVALLELLILLVVDHHLQAAAQAGAREAGLPKATPESVGQAVERTLAGQRWRVAVGPAHVERNFFPAPPHQPFSEGDRVHVLLGVDVGAVLPRWIGMLHLPVSGPRLRASAAIVIGD